MRDSVYGLGVHKINKDEREQEKNSFNKRHSGKQLDSKRDKTPSCSRPDLGV
jgi:tRNA U54 and U55 pseudouridine synthase Pus10